MVLSIILSLILGAVIIFAILGFIIVLMSVADVLIEKVNLSYNAIMLSFVTSLWFLVSWIIHMMIEVSL